MESKQSDRSTSNILKVILFGLLGAALGLFGSVVGFEHLEQPILELQPIHVSIVVGASLLCGSLAAIDVKNFLGALIDSLSKLSNLRG